MKKRIYCISGLGADKRLFQNLHIPEADLVHIHWVAHDKNDSLASYAHKLASQVKDSQPILMGVSFGGMLAIEMAKLLNAKSVFLISSVKSASEFPKIYQLAKHLHLVSLIPSFLINHPSFLMNYIFGATAKKDKDLLRDYLKHADPRYIKWALNAILNWENKNQEGIIHIHGSNDKLIPLPDAVTYKVANGGHFMVYNKADEISKILSKELRELENENKG